MKGMGQGLDGVSVLEGEGDIPSLVVVFYRCHVLLHVH